MNPEALQRVCLGNNNLSRMVDDVVAQVKITEKSKPKCASMLHDAMRNNLSKLDRMPRSREEAIMVIDKLNELAVNSVVRTIKERHPAKNQRRSGSDYLSRELGVYGDRPNVVSNRPTHQSRKDDFTYDSKPKATLGDIGSTGCSFAPAFSSYSFVDDQDLQRVEDRRGGSDMEQRYQALLASRKMGESDHQPAPMDLSLDGSGAASRQKRMMEQQQQEGVPTNDFYASILGQGAPQGYQSTIAPGGYQYTGMQVPQPQGMGPMFQ